MIRFQGEETVEAVESRFRLLTLDVIIRAGVAEQNTGADVGNEFLLVAETREVGSAAAGALG